LKYVFLLGLLALVGGLIYWRLRPYIQLARRIFGAVRDVRRMSPQRESAEGLPRGGSRGREGGRTAEKLVRCAACGTWLPASRAITLRTHRNSHYCSHACLERSADAPPRRKSAS
jgi:hypothetical protein